MKDPRSHLGPTPPLNVDVVRGKKKKGREKREKEGGGKEGQAGSDVGVRDPRRGGDSKQKKKRGRKKKKIPEEGREKSLRAFSAYLAHGRGGKERREEERKGGENRHLLPHIFLWLLSRGGKRREEEGELTKKREKEDVIL